MAIATTNDAVSVLSLHGDYLYWLEGLRRAYPVPLALRRARTSGDAPPETLVENVEIAPYPDQNYYTGANELSLAFDSNYVYWNQGTLDGAIVRCALSGCSGTPELVVPKIDWPIALLLDGSKLYWLHDTNSQGFAVSSCTLGDCASPALLASGLNVGNALAIDDQYLYSVTTDGGQYPDVTVYNPVARIRRFPK
jgi:hypothetical protein